MTTRIIIAGSREFTDYDYLKAKCDEITSNYKAEEIEIISGTAKGADQLGEKYATEKSYKLTRMPAKWETHGISAGHIRNTEMAKYASQQTSILCAFWDGQSRGTKNMIQTAKKYNFHKIHTYTEWSK
ncbi:MAG: DUF2493 domain-containing protein [Synergistaceae bacterium]